MMSENYIVINIHNESDLLQLILDTVPYIPGWITNNNVVIRKNGKDEWKNYPNKTASYFSFDFPHREFGWEVSDENITEYEKEKAIYIKNVHHLSIFLNKIYEMTLEIYPN
jgi:hypothetical protein